jgi:photosystem II stability/assembly factor-like uncharacterized protein
VPQDTPELAISDWHFAQRAYPYDAVNSQLYHQEKDEVLARHRLKLRGGESWNFEGPENIGGRITDIDMPRNSFDEIWIGSASGGVFKSTDKGQTWMAMTEDWGAPPIGDLVIRQSNPREVWVGTGESNGASGSIAYEGFGLLRTVNGGQTWERMGLENTGSIGRIALHPTNPHTVYVAAMGYLFQSNMERGIFRTQDGGQTWEHVLFLGPNSGGSDIIIDPNDPDILYASIWERQKFPGHKIYGGPSSGIYKSIDGGDNWEKLEGGLPTGSVGRIGLAISQSNNQRLGALVIDDVGNFMGFYNTYNAGKTWIRSGMDLTENYRGSGYWYCNVTIDPTNSDNIYICGLDMFKSIDGGEIFDRVCNMHVDHHAIFVHPMDPRFGLVGNDGGLYMSNSRFINCDHFKNIPITQFYTCTLDPIEDDILYGGTQDNNPLIRDRGQNDWERMLGGDGFVTLPDPRTNEIIYSEFQYGNIYKSWDHGDSWERIRNGLDRARVNWEAPFMFQPDNPDVLYLGTHRVHKTNNGGMLWYPISDDLSNGPGGNLVYGTITSLDVSPLDTNIIIAGTDDGNVWITRNNGDDWEKVSQSLPERWVTSVVCDPFDEDRFFVSFSGLKWNEYQPHILRTDDAGVNWEDIGIDLPEVPVNDIIVDPTNSNRYWLATDLGVFESVDEGDTWNPLGDGMPVAIINDIDFRESDRTLLAATYGRSMYSINVPRISTDTRNDSWTATKVLATNGQIILKAAEGNYQIEIYDRSGQFIYSENVIIGPEGRSYLNYSQSEQLKTLVVIVRKKESGESSAFKIVM